MQQHSFKTNHCSRSRKHSHKDTRHFYSTSFPMSFPRIETQPTVFLLLPFFCESPVREKGLSLKAVPSIAVCSELYIDQLLKL